MLDVATPLIPRRYLTRGPLRAYRQDMPDHPDITATKTFANNKHTLTIEINEETIHNLVTSAIESGHGVRYWASVDAGEHERGWRNYFTAKFTEHGGIDAEDAPVHTLSIAKLLNGLQILSAKYPHHFADIIKEDSDATTGDVLVQCALLGDIIYG